MGCKTVHSRPDAGVEIESDAHLLAIDTKMAFTVAACFSALVKVTDMAPAALIWLYHNRDIDRKQALYEAFEGKHYLMEGLARVCAENMLRAAKLIHAALPDVRFLVASFNEEQAAAARAIESASGLPIEIHSGRTQEIIALAHSCIAVSGSVSLELMSRLKPAIIMYRDRSPIGGLLKWLVFHLLVKVKYITLVNLLAGEELYPEFATLRDSSGAMADQIVRWLKHPTEMAERVERLRKVRDVVAVPGACDRAASFLLASVQNPDAARTAA